MASTKLYSLVEVAVAGTPGTGTVTLGAAVAGNRFTFAEAGVANGDPVSYVIRDGSDIERGKGTYTSSGTTLSRDTVRASKIGGTAGTGKLNLTSAAVVYIDCHSEDLDISDFTEDAAPDATADFWWMHDTSAALKKKVKPSNLVRERLIVGRTYYVRTDGSDGNNGLTNSAGGAFLTIQKAIDVAVALDLSIYNVTISIADGTYTGAITLKSYLGVGPIALSGNVGTPANVLISVTGNSCISGAGVTGSWSLSGLKLVAVTPGYVAIAATQGTRIALSGIDFGGASQHIACTANAIVIANGAYTISGGANIHWYATLGGFIQAAGLTITLTGTPAFVQAFAWSQSHARLTVNGNTFSGSATGTRYYADTLGLIDTQGGGASYLPGNAAGSTVTGAVYN
jgi:hypothetical protein